MNLDVIKHYLSDEEVEGVDIFLHGANEKESLSVNEIDDNLSKDNILFVVNPENIAINLNYVTKVKPFGKPVDVSELNF